MLAFKFNLYRYVLVANAMLGDERGVSVTFAAADDNYSASVLSPSSLPRYSPPRVPWWGCTS
jgi:hypothetical protein